MTKANFRLNVLCFLFILESKVSKTKNKKQESKASMKKLNKRIWTLSTATKLIKPDLP